MTIDLTNSEQERVNVLNNNYAVSELYEQIGFRGPIFENKFRFTKQQVSDFFEVDNRTIERLLVSHSNELSTNGYEILSGSRLKKFREAYVDFLITHFQAVSDIDVGDMVDNVDNELFSSKIPSLGVFTFKAFLNIGMLLTGSERARELRSAILNIVIDILNENIGGKTKYINQREEDFLPSAIREVLIIN